MSLREPLSFDHNDMRTAESGNLGGGLGARRVYAAAHVVQRREVHEFHSPLP